MPRPTLASRVSERKREYGGKKNPPPLLSSPVSIENSGLTFRSRTLPWQAPLKNFFILPATDVMNVLARVRPTNAPRLPASGDDVCLPRAALAISLEAVSITDPKPLEIQRQYRVQQPCIESVAPDRFPQGCRHLLSRGFSNLQYNGQRSLVDGRIKGEDAAPIRSFAPADPLRRSRHHLEDGIRIRARAPAAIVLR